MPSPPSPRQSAFNTVGVSGVGVSGMSGVDVDGVSGVSDIYVGIFMFFCTL